MLIRNPHKTVSDIKQGTQVPDAQTPRQFTKTQQ